MPNAQEDTVSTPARELLSLYDEFCEIEAHCAFFCDAVAALGATRNFPLEPASAGGLTLVAERVKAEVAGLKEKVDRIRLHVQARE